MLNLILDDEQKAMIGRFSSLVALRSLQIFFLITLLELLPFECDICGKRLELARTLASHKRVVHEGQFMFRLHMLVFRYFHFMHFSLLLFNCAGILSRSSAVWL